MKRQQYSQHVGPDVWLSTAGASSNRCVHSVHDGYCCIHVGRDLILRMPSTLLNGVAVGHTADSDATGMISSWLPVRLSVSSYSVDSPLAVEESLQKPSGMAVVS